MEVDQEDPCQQARAAILLKTACLFMVGGGGVERKLTMARREGCAMNETVRFGRPKIIDSFAETVPIVIGIIINARDNRIWYLLRRRQAFQLAAPLNLSLN